MTIEARYNYQHNIPEDKRYKGTDYSIQSALDAYIVSRVENRRKLEEMQQEKEYQEYIEKELDKEVRAALQDAFKDFNSIINIKI